MERLKKIQQSNEGRSGRARSRPGARPARAPGLDVSPHYGGRFGYLFAVPKPLIAAINGRAQASDSYSRSTCDLRFASTEARFTTAFAQRGLIAEHGVSWLLPRLVGSSRALDLLLSARKFDGAEAERIGLVQRAFRRRRSYTTWLPRTPAARRHRVAALDGRDEAQIWGAAYQDFNQSLEIANAEMAKSFATEDFREASRTSSRSAPRDSAGAKADAKGEVSGTCSRASRAADCATGCPVSTAITCWIVTQLRAKACAQPAR
jgi:enoyl-CoA hydratase/carnithine racemase